MRADSRSNFSFAQCSSRFSGGNKSDRMMSPGIRNTHPGMIGKISPVTPRIHNPTPDRSLNNLPKLDLSVYQAAARAGRGGR